MKYGSNKFNFKINGILAKSWFWEPDLPFGNAHTFIYSCFNPNLSDFIANKAIRYLLSSCLKTPTSLVPYLALRIIWGLQKVSEKKELNLKSKDTFLVCLASVFWCTLCKSLDENGPQK